MSKAKVKNDEKKGSKSGKNGKPVPTNKKSNTEPSAKGGKKTDPKAIEKTKKEIAAEKEHLLAAKALELSVLCEKIAKEDESLTEIKEDKKQTENEITKLQTHITTLGKEIKAIESGRYQKQFNFSQDKPKEDEKKKDGQPEYLNRSENYDICLAHFAKKKKQKAAATVNSLSMALHNGSRKKEHLETAEICLKWFVKLGELKKVMSSTTDGKDKILYYSKDKKNK